MFGERWGKVSFEDRESYIDGDIGYRWAAMGCCIEVLELIFLHMENVAKLSTHAHSTF